MDKHVDIGTCFLYQAYRTGKVKAIPAVTNQPLSLLLLKRRKMVTGVKAFLKLYTRILILESVH